MQQIRIMSKVEGRKDFVLLGDGYYAITRILGRKRKRDGTVQYRVEWMGSLTTDWVPKAYQMAAVGGIRMEFLCVVLRGEYYVMQIGLCFLFCNIYDRCRG